MFEKRKIASECDGIEISALLRRNEESKVKAIVQLVHGMCEHKERYMEFMEYLAGEGYASVIHDHRGHGESVREVGDLGYFYDAGWRGLVDDIRTVQEMAREAVPDVPVILLGHSMGSMAVRAYAKRYDSTICGLIVCGSPSYNPAAGIGKAIAELYSIFAGAKYRPKIVQKLSFGAFNKGIENAVSPNEWVCSDSEVVKAYDNDPFCNFQFTSNGFVNLFSLMRDAYDTDNWKTSNPDMPVLFISGADDPCLINHGKFEKAVQAMRKAGYINVSSKLYPNMRHEIMNEPRKAEVWKDILDFVKAVIQ